MSLHKKHIMKTAQAYCDAHGLRLTEPRQHVLEIVAASTKPIVAYDILAQLGRKMKNPKPPTAYRAIAFLQEHQFIHRIESLNAYVACEAGHRHAGSQFLICDACGEATEAHLCHLPTPIAEKASHNGFSMNSWTLEIHGTCGKCTPRAKHTAQPCHSHDHI